MTIQANELHIGKSIADSTWVQVSDRRISANGKFHSNRKKTFEIPYLAASIGYFGLAQRNQTEFFSTWVPNTIRHGTSAKTLTEFAEYFEARLNRDVSKQLLKQYPSGFHLCGFAEDGIPEFHYIRNIETMEGAFYKGFKDSYYTTEDFRGRDAVTDKNGNKRKLEDLSNCMFFYVNGDIRNFWQFWDGATRFANAIKDDPAFKDIKTPGERAKWKLEAFASFYEKHSKKHVIGRPIDVIETRA